MLPLEKTGAKQYVEFTVTPSEYEPKPAPDMINAVVDHFACSKDAALFVGDNAIDIEAAIAANVKSCWFTASDGLRPKPDYFISEIKQLLTLDCF